MSFKPFDCIFDEVRQVVYHAFECLWTAFADFTCRLFGSFTFTCFEPSTSIFFNYSASSPVGMDFNLWNQEPEFLACAVKRLFITVWFSHQVHHSSGHFLFSVCNFSVPIQNGVCNLNQILGVFQTIEFVVNS